MPAQHHPESQHLLDPAFPTLVAIHRSPIPTTHPRQSLPPFLDAPDVPHNTAQYSSTHPPPAAFPDSKPAASSRPTPQNGPPLPCAALDSIAPPKSNSPGV